MKKNIPNQTNLFDLEQCSKVIDLQLTPRWMVSRRKEGMEEIHHPTRYPPHHT